LNDTYRNALHRLRTLIEERDLRAALAYLNSLTSHRFSALYRFNDDTLHNVLLFDRTDPGASTFDDIPVLASYCVFVRDSGNAWCTSHAALDDRIGDHPKRFVVQSYSGVPLRDAFGNVFGTLCHFDFEPVQIADEHLELMEAVGPLLQPEVVV
jgi:GAF domain-containing protein